MSCTSNPTTGPANQSDASFFFDDYIFAPMRFAGEAFDQLEALFAAMQAIADSPKGPATIARMDKLRKLADIGRFVATTHTDLLLSAAEGLQQEYPVFLRSLKPSRDQ